MSRIEQNERRASEWQVRPAVTPELVDYYVREGQRMRALAIRHMGRRLWQGVRVRLGGRRRMGRLVPGAAR